MNTVCSRNKMPEGILHLVMYFWQQFRQRSVEVYSEQGNMIRVVHNFGSKCVCDLKGLFIGERR